MTSPHRQRRVFQQPWQLADFLCELPPPKAEAENWVISQLNCLMGVGHVC